MIVIVFPGAASAQVFYTFPRGTTQGSGEFAVGPFIAFGDNQLVRFGAYGRFYLMDYLDAGTEVIVDNIDGDFRSGAGFDLKYQLIPNNSQVPFDLSANGGIGFTSGANVTTIVVPFGGIIASPYTLTSGASLVPYAGVYLTYTYSSLKRSGLPKITDNALDVEARIGASYSIKEARQIFVTLHVGLDSALYAGFNFDL